MPKALCLTSLVASILVVVLFLEDFVMGWFGIDSLAMLGGANLTMDFTFVILGAILIFMSWKTYREQR